MPSSCKEIRGAVVACLQASDCIAVQGHTPSDCIRSPLKEELPTQCQQLLRTYGECKRGMVDMRKRFRGNVPVTNSVETQGSGRAPQLYGGTSTVPDDKPLTGVGSNDTRK